MSVAVRKASSSCDWRLSGFGDLVLVQIDRPVLLDVEDDFRVFGHGGGIERGRQLDVDALLDEGRDDHEDDQQDEENIAQGNDVGFGNRTFPFPC